MTSIKKRLFTFIVALGAAVALGVLPACHTVEGAGKDVESLGEGVADTADDARPYDNP